MKIVTPVVLCLLGLGMAFYPTFISGFERIQPDAGDTRFVIFLLEHSYRWLIGAPTHESLWDLPMFYPAKNMLAHAETLLGVAPIYWVLRGIGLGTDLSFQLWMMCLAILNFVVAHLLIKRVFLLSPLSAAAGAFLFAFASSRVVQFGHQQMLGQFYLLLAVFALYRIFSQDHKKSGRLSLYLALLCVSVTLQLYACFYYFWYFVFFCVLGLMYALVSPVHRGVLINKIQSHWIAFLLCSFATVILSSPVIYHYGLVYSQVGARNFDDVRFGLPYFECFFNMGPRSLIYGWQYRFSLFNKLSLSGGVMQIGIGVLTLALVVIGLASQRKQPALRLLGIISLVSIVISTTSLFGFHLWSPVYYLFPGAGAIRGGTRIGLVLLIPAAIGFAIAIEKLRQTKGKWIYPILAFCICEQARDLPSFDKAWYDERATLGAQQITSNCKTFFYTPPKGIKIRNVKPHLDALGIQLKSNIPTINGYSGSGPEQWNLFFVSHQSLEESNELERNLQSWLHYNDIPRESVCWIYSPKES